MSNQMFSIYDQDTIKVPTAKAPMRPQDVKHRRPQRDPMTLIRAVSLALILLILAGSVLMLFSYPNQLSTFFAPTPTPTYARCVHIKVLLVRGTPIDEIDEVCR